MTAGGVTAAQLRAARALLKLDQQDLCGRAGVAIATLRRMEGADGPVRGNYENVTSVVTTLEAAGVEFISENGGGPGVRLKKSSFSAPDRRKPIGPATDAFDAMHDAIEKDRTTQKSERMASVKETGEGVPQEQWERFEAADKRPKR